MSKTKKILAIMLTLVLSIAMIPTTSVSAAKKVKLNKTKATIYVGKTVTLKLKNNKNKIKWSSSNKKVATVTKKGKVKGKKIGKAIITAKVGKKKYKCKIIVKRKTTNNNRNNDNITINNINSNTPHKGHSWDNVQVVIPDTIGDKQTPNTRVKILSYQFWADDEPYYQMHIEYQLVHTSSTYSYFGYDSFATYFYCYDSQGNIIKSNYLYQGEAKINGIYMEDEYIPTNTAKIVFIEYPM
ncbi:MAG: hypothetical protein HFG29_03980 [Eubacterium sp.]|nr:hypothetical protein [Eubacterium sp.]